MNPRFIGIGLILGLTTWAAQGAEVFRTAQASQELSFIVCVVDEAKVPESAERAALRAKVVACLQRTIGAGWRELRAQPAQTTLAAKQFAAGECDAVIFFGPKRPRKLRRLDAVTFAVDLGPERNYEPVYLIVPAREKALHRTILAGFPKALAPLHPPTVMLAGR